MAGLLMLVRRRNPQRDRAGLIDSLIITLGLALLSWVFLIAPYFHDAALTPWRRSSRPPIRSATSCCWPPRIRLAVDAGKRQPAFYLLFASILALLATDAAYGLVINGTYDGQVILDVGWITFYLLWGAAALHPSMRELDQAAPERDARLRPLAPRAARRRLAGRPGRAVLQELRARRHRPGRGHRRLDGALRPRRHAHGRPRAPAGALRPARARAQRRRAPPRGGDHARGDLPRRAGATASLTEARPRAALPDRGRDARRPPTASSRAAWPLHARYRGWRAARSRRRRALEPGAPRASAARRPPAPRDVATRSCSASRCAARRAGCSSSPARPISPAAASGLARLAAQVSLALESAALTEEVHRRESEARFGSLVQHSSDLITVLDRDGTIKYQSPSIERLLGYTPAEVVGTPFDLLLHPGEKARLLHLLTEPRRAPAATPRSSSARCATATARAPVRDPPHEPARRRERARHRAQQPRRQRAQGLRAAARAPGVPRPGHRPRQPRALRRARAPRASRVRGARARGSP